MIGAKLRIAGLAIVLAGLAAAPSSAQRPPSMEQQQIAILQQQLSASQASAMQLQQRLDSIERQLQQLINQGEVNGHRVAQLESQLAALKNDTNGRLTALETRPAEPPQSADVSADEAPPVETRPKPRTQTASTPPSSAPGKASSPTETASADPGEEAYTEGFHLWRDGKYAQAITALKAFVAEYPKHSRVSFAHNLIGRALLDSGQPRAAANALLANYRNDPKGARAADSLFYLGQAMMRLSPPQPGQACKAYAELEDVYGSSIRADLKSLVAKGKADARCS
jgi:TolA-binding protein